MSVQQDQEESLESHQSSSSDDEPKHLYSSQCRLSEDLPVLFLTSHAHSPPLSPPPDLKYDLRSLPNPPKNVRDAQIGTSKRLQEWLLADARFVTRRNQIEVDIKAAMTKAVRTDESSKVHVERGGKSYGGLPSSESESFTDGLGVLRVGISCAMGKHRSVAMVEQLCGISWPGWQVKVVHRDALLKRGGANKGKTRGRQNREIKGARSLLAEDEDE